MEESDNCRGENIEATEAVCDKESELVNIIIRKDVAIKKTKQK